MWSGHFDDTDRATLTTTTRPTRDANIDGFTRSATHTPSPTTNTGPLPASGGGVHGGDEDVSEIIRMQPQQGADMADGELLPSEVRITPP